MKLLLVVLTLCAVLCNPPTVVAGEGGTVEPMTFVIVHGATGGGWDWKVVAQKLSAKGHSVYRATLTGLGERVHLANPDVDLSTHIQDVVNLIRFEQLTEVVLVGHSYGGMVLTGAMNEIPERIRHAIFLDAAVPEHGMSAIEVWGGLFSPETKIANGLIYFPWLEPAAAVPKDVPHPHKSVTEPVSFDNPKARTINATFVAFVPEGVSQQQRAEDPSWQRAKQRGWTMRTFDGDHVIYRQKPDEITALLIAATRDKNGVASN